MTIHDEYLFYQEKYEKKYGKNKTIVFMQVGSFHEAYGTDTRGYNLTEISELLNIILTKKDKKIKEVSEKNPYMIGFPSVALNKYLKVLIDNGFTVVIIDQTTPPPNPKREITGIYSPGTYIQESFSPDSNNIVCLYIEDELQKNGYQSLTCIGMSVVDLSTGENTIHEAYSQFGDDKYALDEALRFLNSYNPTEVIIYKKGEKLNKDNIILYLELDSKIYHYYDCNSKTQSKLSNHYFKLSYQNEFLSKIYKDTGMLSTVEYLDLERKPYATISFIALLDFAYQHNENIITNLFKPLIFKSNKHLILGNNAGCQLNVFENNNLESFSNCRYKSLFDVVNNTSTAIGRRYLKYILSAPLIDIEELKTRYDCIEEAIGASTNINNSEELYVTLEDHLKCILDLERLNRKVSLNIIHPFEFANLLESYDEVYNIIKVLRKTDRMSKLIPEKKIVSNLLKLKKECNKTFKYDEMKKYCINDIQNSFFKKGINKKIDNIQNRMNNNMEFMENICVILSKYIDVKSKFNNEDIKINIKKNDRDGYYLDLTKIRAQSLKKNLSNLKTIKVTDDYNLDPKQLEFKELSKGNTKIFFDDLTKKSNSLIVLREKIMNMCKDGYVQKLNEFYQEYAYTFKKLVEFVSIVDFIKSSAKTAKLNNYVKPAIVVDKNDKGLDSSSRPTHKGLDSSSRPTHKGLDNGYVKCENLRHPIVERIKEDTEYIPHNVELGRYGDNELDGMLIYGINSAGKSTTMKALGLSIIMAQTGMFVPATSFKYSPYDSLFARISSNDNIFKGLSSFALEMTELRAILKRTGPKTLVIGDEVCRGTEHTSGNSIVATTIINLAKTGSSFIFATHLHEIAKMERIKNLKNVKAFHLTVDYDEENDALIFDRLLKPGHGTEVYGITVAKYIIHDKEFMGLAQEIKNELTNQHNVMLPEKTSKYNTKVYIDKCHICGIKNNIGGYFDTHHINHQKDCKDGFVKDKPHIKMNSKYNLIPLCESCHHKVHHGELDINGYLDTSKGKMLDYQVYDDKLIDTSDNSFGDDHSCSDNKEKSNKKYNDADVKKILKMKDKNISQMKAKRLLKEKYEMNVGVGTIKRVWTNEY
jgi:DNA mismatch repair protein MutS